MIEIITTETTEIVDHGATVEAVIADQTGEDAIVRERGRARDLVGDQDAAGARVVPEAEMGGDAVGVPPEVEVAQAKDHRGGIERAVMLGLQARVLP